MNNQVGSTTWDSDHTHVKMVKVQRILSDVESMVIDVLKKAFIDLQPRIDVKVDMLTSNRSVSKNTDLMVKAFAVQFWTGVISIECHSAKLGHAVKHYEATFSISVPYTFIEGCLLDDRFTMVVELVPNTNVPWENKAGKAIRTASLVKQALVTYIKTTRPHIGYFQSVDTAAASTTV